MATPPYKMLVNKLGSPNSPTGHMETVIYNPPNVKKTTRIIGLVGINDHQDSASPSADGWFLSDFYLFNYLLAGLGRTQAWFTCLDPIFIVGKYKEYAHGNPYSERRIVLDQHQLPNAATLKIEADTELLSSFLSYLKSECNAAKLTGDPVLVFVFGHGDEDHYGVSIGWDGISSPAKGLNLMMDEFKTATGDNVEVCTIMTSCYSGGWVMNPNLNMTSMAACGSETTSESWASSKSVERCCGSIYGSALLRTLSNNTLELLPSSTDDQRDMSQSYKDFCTEFQQVLVNKVDRLGNIHHIQFSAQNDQWLMPWHSRTGYPLALFKERWEMLRQILPQENSMSNRSPTHGGLDLPDPTAESLYGRSGSTGMLSKILNLRVKQYVACHPGREGLWPNIIVNCHIQRFASGSLDFDGMSLLYKFLEYRLFEMHAANNYLLDMGLASLFPRFQDWDEDRWILDCCLGESRREVLFSSWSKKARKLFPQPPHWGGRKWPKPTKYIAAACVTAILGGMKEDDLDVIFNNVKFGFDGELAKLVFFHINPYYDRLALHDCL